MKKRKLLTKIILSLLAGVLLMTNISAQTPYITLTTHEYYEVILTQTAYEPLRTITKIDDLSMNSPSDLRMGSDGNLYIADTGNGRIIVSTVNGELIKTVGEGYLKKPKGAFPTSNGDIYVADEELQLIVVFDEKGEIKNEYGRPDHPLFGTYSTFRPTKVVVDKRGNMYIISTGNTNGIIQISPSMGGEFLGYFGANQTKPTLMTRFRQLFYSDDQLNRLADVVPITTTNLDIDEKGLVFTVSQGDGETTQKKLNVAGKNILNFDFYESYPAAITTSKSGNIYLASKSGYLYEFSPEGKLVFNFGAFDDGQQRTGLFNTISGLVVDDENHIYAIDEKKNSIEIFSETEFTKTVHEGFTFLGNGQYIESEKPWSEVVEMNSMFSFANVGLGEAKYRQEEYAEALKYFRLGIDKNGYSDAFWELRSDWLKDNMGYIIIVIILIVLAILAVSALDRKYAVLGPVKKIKKKITGIKFISSCTYTFHSLRNPADTSYGIKREKRTKTLPSLFMLLLLFIIMEVRKYGQGFLFKSVPDGYYDIIGDMIMFFGIFAVAVICCYLVCTITEGETAFKELIQGVVCALAPLYISNILILILSNILTLNESFFITFIDWAAIIWTVILVILAIKNLNDYSFKKTFATIIITLFVVLITLALLFVIYVLISQVIEFITAIASEVVYKFA